MNVLSAWILLIATVLGQQIGPTKEVHPKLKTEICSIGGGCLPQDTSIVLDSQWRDLIDDKTGVSCITDEGTLNKTICSTVEECGRRCALYGADYEGGGIDAEDGSLTLHMYKRWHGKLLNVQPQVYLLEGQDYRLLRLLNQEVSFDVDASNLPCGMDAAMYLAEMDADGGRSKLNPAGASYGTGYCDSQCYNSYNFVNGIANIGYKHGTCCNEMDLWEANSRSHQWTAHPCNLTGFYACTGDECDAGNRGPCDRTGCGFNPYDLGDHDFYGFKGTVDTHKPFKVITQFPTDDGTIDGTLVAIRRLYIQDGELIHNADIKLEHETYDSLTSEFCQHTYGHWAFHRHGGLAQMGKALKRGMVLVMGIWNDPADFNNWLDAGEAGPCDKKEGSPKLIKKNSPDTSVTFTNIKWGDIGSTYQA